jgi:hypothetical protein
MKPKIAEYEEEVEERDDKIIGKALRWSLVVLLVVGGPWLAGFTGTTTSRLRSCQRPGRW